MTRGARQGITIVALLLAVAAVIFHRPLIARFTRGGHSPGAADPSVPNRRSRVAHAHEFSPAARDQLERAFAAYEQIRTRLAADRADTLSFPARQLAAALRAALAASPGAPPRLRAYLEAAARTADALGGAASLDAARAGFAALSENAVAIAAADPSVASRLHVMECPMTKGFNRWLQRDPKLTNPYQGSKMLTCGSEIEWGEAAGSSAALDPVKLLGEGIGTSRRQLIGLKVAPVVERAMTLHITATGRVTYDERRLADVSLKYDGFIQKLHASDPGQRVARGKPLFTIYSRELYNAQQEYIFALAQRDAAVSESGKHHVEAMLSAARARLRLWDLTGWHLRELARRKQPIKYVTISAPTSGHVIEKSVVAGSGVKAGQRLFRIANLDRVWVEAEVHAQSIRHVERGQRAEVTLTNLPGRRFEGKVAFIQPHLDRASRTVKVRIELDNRTGLLKPDMFADVRLKADLGKKLAIPETAIIDSGARRIVFVKAGDQLYPKQIEVEAEAGGYVAVRSGLAAGQTVVVSANFLLAAESRLKEATGLW